MGDGLRFLLRSALVFALIFSLAAFADRLTMILELFSHLRPHLLLVTLLLLPFALLLRDRLSLLAILLVSLLNLGALHPLWWGNGPNAQAAGQGAEISFYAHNVQVTNPDIDQVIDAVIESDPDIVTLSEAGLFFDHFRQRLDPAWPEPAGDNNWRQGNVLLGSRLPVLSLKTHTPQNQSWNIEEAVVLLDGQNVTILAVHPPPPVTGRLQQARDEHFDWIIDWAERTEGPKIVIGDFNTTPWSGPFRHLLAETGLHFAGAGRGWMPTWSVGAFYAWFGEQWGLEVGLPIDHLLYSDGLKLVRYERGPRTRSDHAALLAVLRLSP